MNANTLFIFNCFSLLIFLLFFISLASSSCSSASFLSFKNKNKSLESISQNNQTRHPTLYQYYINGGIKSGLKLYGDQFKLNDLPFVIYGGTFHYFRVIPQRWRTILQRFKAAGLNTVQFYIPWNLHEDRPDNFDFKTPSLDLEKFLNEIRSLEMFAIIRTGPYITAEWEMGGLPSWLLRDANMKLRENYQPFIDRVEKFWNQLMKIINRYQFSLNGGPVLMLQLEDEYYGAPIQHSLPYLRRLIKIVRESGFQEPLFVSENVEIALRNITERSINELSLISVNFNDHVYLKLTKLKSLIPNKPIFVSEFWTGWFDNWLEKNHSRYSVDKFIKGTNAIVMKVNASINFYVFIGGTNFGFMNGFLEPSSRVVTSYDYDAPLTENGNYTEKYYATRKIYDRLVAIGRLPKIDVPVQPPPVQKVVAYGTVTPLSYVSFEHLLNQTQHWLSMKRAVEMELLNVGPGYGQRFGFVLYRITVPNKSTVKYDITGPIADRGIFMINGKQISVLQDEKNFSYTFDSSDDVWKNDSPLLRSSSLLTFDILVENQGRADWGILEKGTLARKGISSPILIDNMECQSLDVYSLDFNQTFVKNFAIFNDDLLMKPTVKIDDGDEVKGQQQPQLYIAHLTINDTEPSDTYLQLPGWTKGNVFVNTFNLGRYWNVGPQRTLYIPGPLLQNGLNVIQIFELHQAGKELHFIDYPILG